MTERNLKRPVSPGPEGTAQIGGEKRPKLDPDQSFDSSSQSPTSNGSLEHDFLDILGRPTALNKLLALASLPDPLPALEPVCSLTTTTSCPTSRTTCPYAHYDPIHRPWTEPRLGQCSYLNTCFGDPAFANNPSLASSGPSTRPGPGPSTGAAAGTNGERAPKGGGTRQCRYLHYRVLPPPSSSVSEADLVVGEGKKGRGMRMVGRDGLPGMSSWLRRELVGWSSSGRGDDDHDDHDNDMKEEPDKTIQATQKKGKVGGEKESQWLNMDVRQLDEGMLGKFELILADPPWDIHMNLPYALLTDDDLRLLPIPSLQPTWGLLALWVTGRAMELARELFVLWGYRRVDEVVWVKTNQLGGLVRTGRTGHWLNHTCEHLLLAVKLPPVSEFPDRSAPIPWTDPALAHLRRGIDGDVVVSEVRETSRKPDEVYGLLERMVPSGRKLEIFGRKHNTRRGWLTIGNQLGDSKIVDPELKKRVDEAKILLDDTASAMDKKTRIRLDDNR